MVLWPPIGGDLPAFLRRFCTARGNGGHGVDALGLCPTGPLPSIADDFDATRNNFPGGAMEQQPSDLDTMAFPRPADGRADLRSF
jgi:hypothetical protein